MSGGYVAGGAHERTVHRPIGGQAVIEGVMIRSPERIATAVRAPDGGIVVRTDPYISLTKRVRGFGLPLVRGVVVFGEMLSIGLGTLNYSASIASPEEERASLKDTLLTIATTVFTFGVAMLVFFALPLALADLLGLDGNPLAYNLVAGGTRVVLLIAYVSIIGRMKEIARTFAYHGAEHQVVFAYEAGEDVSVSSARRFSRFHPRCGTSFMLIVVLLAVVSYAAIDAAFAVITGQPPGLVERILTHLLFLPVVSGLAYEGLRVSGAYQNSPLMRMLSAPGLWLQRLTTREPDDDQLEVAVRAAREALGLPEQSHDVRIESAATVA